MARRSTLISQSEAERFMKATRVAGYERARMIITRPEGTVELIGENIKIDASMPTNTWDVVLEK